MKIFVGWAYEATWIEKYAIPLIESHGVEVLTGKELQGQAITEKVKELLAAADATIFFTTRREDNQDGTWTTSEWVIDEIKHAESIKKTLVLEVRENGVEYPNKINAERQHIKLASDDKIEALVDLAVTVGRWRRLGLKIKLTPDKFVESIKPRVFKKDYSCAYAIRQAGKLAYGPQNAEIVREASDLYIYAIDLPADLMSKPDAFLEVTTTASGSQWISTGSRLGALEVVMEKLE